MKKYLIALLTVIACLCTAFAFGCTKKNKPKTFDVEFTACEGVTYTCGSLSENSFTEGTYKVEQFSNLSFTIVYPEDKDATVSANESRITPSAGVYTFAVTDNTVIDILLTPHVIAGSGTQTSPFVLTKAVDLVYVAERVNGGDQDYIYAYYELGNDISANGETIDIIGDGSILETSSGTTEAFFAGTFNGNGYTISDFKIESDSSPYVGLFGNVSATGNDDDSAIIINLNLKNFEIVAAKPSDSNMLFVGSFIGFGLVPTLIACSATEGSISVNTDNVSSVFVGGAIGAQQSYYLESGGAANYYYATADYIHTDVDINCGGRVYSAGGIIGYLYSMENGATSSLVNSYSTGNVFGAMRTGGLVGFLSSYSSIANCYSTGEVYSYATSVSAGAEFDAYAGGLVGYAGVDSIVSDSFAKNEVTADVGGYAEKHIGAIVGGKEAAGLTSEEIVLFNTYSGNEVTTSGSFFEKLGWQSYDWVLADGSYPVINDESVSSSAFVLTYDLGSKTLGAQSTLGYSIEVGDKYYVPLSYYIAAEAGLTNSVDDPARILADDGYASYGLYFDSQLTTKVPLGYIVSRKITLYVGFADLSQVAGTYYITKDGNISTLVLNNEGGYTFTNYIDYPVIIGNASYPTMRYTYDGERIIFENGVFARLSDVRDAEHPEYNYSVYSFVAKLTDGALAIYDGVYFTEDAPLTALKTAPAREHDEFYGTWVKAANINKTYTFVNGNWTYSFKDESFGGTYTIADDGTAALTLANGTAYGTAHFVYGQLAVAPIDKPLEIFSLEDSYYGQWYDLDRNALILLYGFGNSLGGDALCYINGLGYELSYVMDGYFDENGLTTITLLSGYSLFGYLYMQNGTLLGSLYNDATAGLLGGYTFYLVDSYDGEWVGDNNGEILVLDFNGYGIYNIESENGLSEVKGWLTIDGERIPYECDLEDGSTAKFTYKGTEYVLEFDDVNNTVYIRNAGGAISCNEFERKDEWSDYTLIDDAKNIYSFNGGGNLSIGGKLTITSANGEAVATLGYRIVGGGIEEHLDDNGNNNTASLDLYANDAKVGSITIRNYKFVFNYEGGTQALSALDGKKLTLDTPFTGVWAVSYSLDNFEVGTIDLTYETTGKFMDMPSATYYYYPSENMLLVYYSSTTSSEGISFIPFYILYMQDNNLAISSQTYLSQDARYCAPADEMYGMWVNSEKGQTIMFDGLADSMYTFGVAWDGTAEGTYLYVRRFGRLFIWQYLSEEYFEIIDTRLLTGENLYVSGGKRKLFVSFDDSAPIYTARDTSGTEYAIYLSGDITIGGEACTYEIERVEGKVTYIVATLGDNTVLNLAIDYTDTENVTATQI